MKIQLNRYIGVTVIAFGTIFSTSAFSVETIDLPAGRSYSGDFYVFNESNCESAGIGTLNYKQPKNGKVSSRKGRSKVPAGQACAGKSFPAWIVTYTPNKGFRGKECGSISLNYPLYIDGNVMTSKNYPICFNVK
jgi:hypothetical protein